MKICAISDTHSLHSYFSELPEADVLIHCGDFMNTGIYKRELDIYQEWLISIAHKYEKIIQVGGNHDIMIENISYLGVEFPVSFFEKELENKFVYLCDSSFEYKGVKFWGSPYSPEFYDWAFMEKRGEDMKKHWDKIPLDTNVIITHTPPKNILDRCANGFHAGCEELGKKVQELPELSYNFFGHIHEAYGVQEDFGVTFVNCSLLDERYKPINSPYTVDYENRKTKNSKI